MAAPKRPPLKRYLVGGAVRDQLLGRPIKDRDWVVLGETNAGMLARGYKQVGAAFPVFLDSETGEEHALARTEVKTGKGHQAFAFSFGPEVSLEEDLCRRDLTVNAMALGDNGQLIDPHGGEADLNNQTLRHVGDAFVEDPLRVLRACRFAAQLGFEIADETMALMAKITESGELETLSAERLWHEIQRALMTQRPSRFLQTMRGCGALKIVLPEIDALYGIPQRKEFHPEIDTGIHTELVIDQAALNDAPLVDTPLGDTSLAVRFGCLVHDVGKALTPKDLWPRHLGHEEAGVPLTQAINARLKVPKTVASFAEKATALHMRSHLVMEMTPKKIMRLLEELDAFRHPQWVDWLGVVGQCDKRGRTTFEQAPYPQAAYLKAAYQAAAQVQGRQLLDQNPSLEGPKLGEAVRVARIDAIRKITKEVGK